MQKAKLSWLFILNVFLVIVLAISLSKPALVQSAAATHVVISEVQVGAADADDEFVELYNPTASAIDMAGWRLTKKTSTGTQSTLLSSISGTIPSHGFFLIAPAVDYTGSTAADQNYSTGTRIAANNSVLLYSDGGITVVDKLGLGTAVDAETAAFATNPAAGQSVERKANSSSTQASMLAGDAGGGNAEDTNNNSNDFVLRDTSQPQNTASAETPNASPAPSVSPSPSTSPSASPSTSPSPSPSASASPSPSASPSVSPSPSASVSPSSSPSPSASPSASASPSPSASASVSPSPSPSANPSVSPSASPSASPSVSPSASPSASANPSPSASPKPHKQFVCKFETVIFKFGNWTITWPTLSCSWKIV